MDASSWAFASVACGAAAWGLLATRALTRRVRELEGERTDSAASAALAASDERARIAREMHDVVAHTLAVVVAQSDGGRLAGAKDPRAAIRALETIADVGRAALDEMRGLLGLLRESDGTADMGPQPTLDDIPALVASVRDGGLEVSFVTTGTPHPVPIGAVLAVYRIVQEALTNVLKHAGPKATAFAQLRWAADGLEVTVSDDGRGAASSSREGGTGLEGMRERATLFGGTLQAGPKRGGGYVVHARIPLTPRGKEMT